MMTAPVVPLPVEFEDISVDEVCDVLMEIILPYYKGFPDSPEEYVNPKFRKSLSGEETYNVLSSIHHLIMSIKMSEYTDLAEKLQAAIPGAIKKKGA